MSNQVNTVISSPLSLAPSVLEQGRWTVLTSALSTFLAELFSQRAENREDLGALPKELKSKVCEHLDLRSLANLGETCRVWHLVVGSFLPGYLKLNREMPVPAVGQTKRIIDDLKEKIHVKGDFPKDIRLMIAKPTMAQIHYLQKWVEAREVLDQWTLLLDRIKLELPNLNWNSPVLTTAGDSAAEIAMAAEFQGWLEANEPFLVARDTLQVWQVMSNQSEILDKLISPEEVIREAAKFTGWVDQHREDLSQRTELDFNECYLTSLPPEIGELFSLTNLNLSDNLLTKLPESVYQLTQLKMLDLSNNRIFSISDAFFNLKALISLNLSGNKLSSLSKKICRFRNLRFLDLSRNRLISLPGDVRRLSDLKELWLDNNYLFKLNEGIGGLQKLAILSAVHNHLTQLPESLKELSNLVCLEITGNYLPTISQYPDMPNLVWISANGNRISSFQLCKVNYLNVMRVAKKFLKLF